MTFPERLVQTRHALRLTQAELARALDVTPQTLSNWECGRTAPWPKQLDAVRWKLLQMDRPSARERIIERI